MKFTADQIAILVNGRVEGDANVTVNNIGKIEYGKAGDLSFLANPKYEDYLYTTKSSIVLVNDSLQLKQAVNTTLIRVADAYSAFAKLLNHYQQLSTQQLSGIQEPSFIHATASFGNNCFIAAFCYIGKNVKIGDNVKLFSGVVLGSNVTVADNTILHAGVKIYNDCMVGKNVLVHAGTVIGSDGFGFAPNPDGSYSKVPQIGNVIIEDNVEIGANTTIDRATIGSTIVRQGTKLDNLIQIAHNVEIGNNTVVAAQAGISGSTKVGNQVMIGGQAGIVGHISIANGSKINAQSGVSKSITQEKTYVTGTPAYDYTAALRSQVVARSLPEMEKRIRALEEQLSALLKNQTV